MKDDLHELIDGDLPDEQAAEFLHLLSVDPEKRTVFRQQMQLQRGLYRNERHAELSSLEEGEMLGRISSSIGESAPGAGRFARRGIVMLAVGFLVGSGAGYVGHSLVSSPSMTANPGTVQVYQQVPTPTPVVVNINRDSLVTAIGDSLNAERLREETGSTTRKTAKAPVKRKSNGKPKGNSWTGK